MGDSNRHADATISEEFISLSGLHIGLQTDLRV
jgi:hypothetical protein